MKNVLKKLLICICLFIIVFNFIMIESNYVYASFDSDAGTVFTPSSSGGGASNTIADTITSTLSGIVGLLTWVMRLPFAVAPIIVQSIGSAVAQMDGRPSGVSGFVFLTPYHIIFNEINLTSIDFFTLSGSDAPPANSATYLIRVEIAKWYYVMRIIAIAILLGILIFVGIKMAISTVATEKAIYKKALFDWVTSLALVFLLHYIIRAVLWINTELVEILRTAAGTTNLDTLFNEMAELMFKVDFLKAVTAIIVYIMITIQTLMFLINYIKRMLTLAFLIIISPLITITYSIDKMGDQKAQALNTWLKEFSYNVLIQPFHAILYIVFVSTAIELMKDTSGVNSVAASVLAIFCIKFVWDGEKIVRKIFGFEQASSLAAAAASGAVIGNMLGKAQSIGKGAASGIKFAKNSKTGQMIKQKHDQRKDTKMQNKAAQKITGNKNATYASLNDSQKKRADKQVAFDKEQKSKTPIRKIQEKREFNKLKKKTEAAGTNVRDSVLKQQAAKNVDKKKINFQNNHKFLSAMGTDAKKFSRQLVDPKNMARIGVGATVAAAMYAMPDTNLVTSIGAGHVAGKSASEGVRKLKENKKEHFEENIMKAWNNHCNITGNNKNSREEFNKWYENTYNKGKQLDEYSQKNMGKAEGAAKKDLQEAGIQAKDLDAIISQLQKAILTKEPYDPTKLFTGYKDSNNVAIDPSVIAAAVAGYAAKFNESYAFKNVSDYNTQMGQFGVTADDAVNGITAPEFESYLTPEVQAFTVPEATQEVIETSTNTAEVLENEKLELVSEQLETAYNVNGGETADLNNVAEMLQNMVAGKLANIEGELRSNVSGMGSEVESQMEQAMNDIIAQVRTINPDTGNLESQISNIVNNAMSTLKLDSAISTVTPEQSVEIQNNLRNYTNQQIVNNYVSNNYSNTTMTAGFNPEKLKSDLEKIVNQNR